MSLQLLLPTGNIEKLDFSVFLTANSLKIKIEKRIGIPYELQIVYFNGRFLDDNRTLGDQGVSSGSTLKVEVDMWWTKIVSLSLQGNTTTLRRRVSIPMQQIGESNRIFVTLFICVTRGNPKGVDNLLSMFKDFDLGTVTKVTGRTLLHAAIGSGSLKCVEEIKKHAGMSFEQLLSVKDRSGQSALDELTVHDTRMLNYVNKFLSHPVDVEQLKNRDDKDFDKENTYIIEPSIKEIKRDNGVKNDVDKLDIRVIRESSLPRLERTKGEQNTNVASPIQTENIQQTPSISVAPIIIQKTENSKSLRVGEAIPALKDKVGHLPLIPQRESSSHIYSPRPMRKTSQSSYVPHISKSPRPPSQDKKRPVAGKMMESNLRKFSAASRPKILPPDHTSYKSLGHNHHHPMANHGSNQLTVNQPNNQQQRPMSPSPKGGNEEKKVRRISLIKSPRPLSPNPYGHGSISPGPIENGETEDQVIIEIEQERIEKPWNNWIKAVTVEAETPSENIRPITPRPISPYPSTSAKGRKTSLQVQNGNSEKVRKKSFDEWVVEKAQEEQDKEMQKMREAYETEQKEAEARAAHSGKSFDEWVLEKEQNARLLKEQQESEKEERERYEAEMKAKQQGKTFDQWRKEKEEYDKLLKQQQEHEEKENLKPQKFLKGKTFEEWQKETESKRRQETEEKKQKDAKKKEKQDTEKLRRRKESTAKYQQWLLDKERLALEKEMQEFKNKRKVSTAKARKTSTMKKT